MPELPEVENTRLSLEPILGHRVTGVRLLRRDILVVPGDPAGGWGRQGASPPRPKRYRSAMLLNGLRLTGTLRHGKRMAMVGGQAEVARAVEIGLGMSGRVEILSSGRALPTHSHAVWSLDDGRRLVFVDHRRFGGLWAWPSLNDLMSHWKSTLGPDALSIRAAVLRQQLASSQRPVKAALLDQRVLSGVGNIYADEACFEARVAPGHDAACLPAESVTRLARAIRRILRASIQQGGSTLRDFQNASGLPGEYQHGHRVYGRGGKCCLVCGGVLMQATLTQRTTVWCPVCQHE